MSNDLLKIENEINRVFNSQKENKQKLKQHSAKERIQRLKKLLNCMIKYEDEIARAIYMDFKKPEEEVLLTEIYPVKMEINAAIKNLHKWMKAKKVRNHISQFGSKSSIRYEPMGVSLIISPWNFPFNLTFDPLVSAIAAGNAVIIKPSEFSPNTTAFMKMMLSEIFCENEVYVFEGDYTVSKLLLEKPFDNIFFTGSPGVGKIVMEAASKNLARVTLELGGKSPVIIDKSADIEVAASRIAWGKCLNAGQICVAPDYVLIPYDKKDEFISSMKNFIAKYYGELDKQEGFIDFCRIINKKHYLRIKGLIEEAVNLGSKLEFGGCFDEKDNFISPTIISNIPEGCKILEEEIFGPVLPVIIYNNIKDAIAYVNSKPKPLALYIFSKDSMISDYILANTDSGDVLINDVVVHVANCNLPFGGINNSGIGKCHGYHGFMAFTHERSCQRQAKKSVMSMLYPPFEKKASLIKKIIKYF